jgi:tetraacyldisaccharide 4'-kinase
MVYSPQGMNWLLFPLSFAYRAGSWTHQFLYDSGLLKKGRTHLPVISVGSIAFGGTEKTPLALQLLSFCLDKGLKPALITRGYKGGWERTGGVLSDGKKTQGFWPETGDEPFMVSRRVSQAGIYVGRKRLTSCLRAEQDGFDVLILDDGFQHRSLHRDVDIVLFNPEKRAVLREFVSSFKRADIILVKKNGSPGFRNRIKLRFPRAKIFSYSIENEGFFSFPDNTPVPVETLKKRRILAVCGIARPERFLSLLEACGLKPLRWLIFPDHHSYPLASRKKICATTEKIQADSILATEKDVFKLEELAKNRQVSIYYNRIGLQVDEDFYRELTSSLKAG